MKKGALLLVLLAATLASLELLGCISLKRSLVSVMTPSYPAAVLPEGGFVATFDKADADRPRIDVRLSAVATGLLEPTDLAFVPGEEAVLIALEKSGSARWIDLDKQRMGTFLRLEVLDRSEQGLLGIAFHPKFLENGRFFLNATVKTTDEVTQISEWSVPPGSDLREAVPKRGSTILEQVQPYPNHNAGQLAFGPDGMLYVGFGDGGWKDDPHGAGQDPKTWLGKMLRIDVDAPGKPYAVPPDNPFLGDSAHRPETWALGLRNPWRYSFDPKGRLVVADVGQDEFEEISILGAGDNAGWNRREARHCFPPGATCTSEGLLEPIYEYGRDDGGSITGGFVAGAHVPALDGKYVFADFLSGRVWAIDLPDATSGPLATVYALGRWPFLPSTFGRDEAGRLFVTEFRTGTVFRIDPAP